MDENRRRTALRARIAARRAGTPRRLEQLSARFGPLAAGQRLRCHRRAPRWLPHRPPRAESPRGALLAWQTCAATRHTPFLPADPAHFANFFAEYSLGARGRPKHCHQQLCSTSWIGSAPPARLSRSAAGRSCSPTGPTTGRAALHPRAGMPVLCSSIYG